MVPMALAHPDGTAILALEQDSRRLGSGLSAADLEGTWRLWEIWSRQQARPMPAAAALLRSLGATLAITDAGEGRLGVVNSVQLGTLQLRFVGQGELRGRRPLLVFWFERLELRFGERRLWQRDLPRPQERSLPFFALIASRRQGEEGWLAARGRGGGLALWRDPGALSRSEAAAPH